jgi:5-methylcytosine-specific restriction endonuclease McrBC GTP-binding regulatory subunit McrB
LAQSQKECSEAYPGLGDVMTLILLDEMNLAHVELYFAEFLSKLESRRGKPQYAVESLDVKLGSGIQPYQLNLGRNVLWTGTMNQDETTKSLSDKVLDRGIIINFPRPTSLERREKLNSLGKGTPLLPRVVWQSWRQLNSPFTPDQIKPYKSFVEEMNNSLAKVSRALGHRVWQSIEYYMANYPTIIKAIAAKNETDLNREMKTAFEDQLVQKVMPKLRGIETRGKAKTDCIDKIRSQLERDNYKIINDFDLACEFGYGQFIWNSANYIKEDDTPSAGSTGEETSGDSAS